MNENITESRFVVLADVISSREIDDRSAFQKTLDAALDALNDEYADAIDTPFEPIKGVDEFGGVLTNLGPVYEVVTTVLDRIHPVRVRFTITQGEIDVGTTADRIAEMDGTPFHRADELLSEVESADLYTAVETGHAYDSLVAGTVNLLLIAREGLTERQVEVIRAYEHHGTQTAAADALEVPQQSISKTLQRADYHRTKRLRTELQQTLTALYD